MSVSIRVEGNIDAVLKSLNRAERVIIPQAAARALNKSMDRIYTLASREIAAHHKIKPLKLLTGTRGQGGRMRKYPANAQRLSASVWIGLDKAIKVPISEKNLEKLLKGPKSKPFTISKGKYQGVYVRHPLPSTRYSNKRPQTSTPNLPFKRIDAGFYRVRLGRTAATILKKHGEALGFKVFNEEFIRQINVSRMRAGVF